jgi:glutamate racemase
VTQGDIVAKSLATYLQNHPEMDQKCSKNGQLLFFTTDNPTSFEEQGSLFFGQKIAANHTDLA